MLRFVLLNVLGGIAVLGSYAHGIATHPTLVPALWGEMPASLQSVYNVTMLVAAAGYFPFTYVFLRHGRSMTYFGTKGLGTIEALYALVLVPSALWMPLTFAWLESPSTPLWLAVRGVLALVAFGSYGLFAALVTAKPRVSTPLFAAAVLGLLAFTLQTGVLDPWIWPLYL
ncbi:MAG: hypothetical protein U0230_15765 [Polyangiales bacterium]